MARAVSSIDRFDPVGMGLSAWIFGICRHVVADSLRSAARADRLGKGPGRAAHALAEAVPIDAIVDRLEHEEEAVALRLAYANLSEEDRELLDLRVIAGLSAEEVGVLLDRNAGAVRMAQSRALARLRTQFKLVYR